MRVCTISSVICTSCRNQHSFLVKRLETSTSYVDLCSRVPMQIDVLFRGCRPLVDICLFHIQSYILEFIVHISIYIYVITAAKQKLLLSVTRSGLFRCSGGFRDIYLYLQFHLERSFSISKCSKLILDFFCLPELPSTL